MPAVKMRVLWKAIERKDFYPGKQFGFKPCFFSQDGTINDFLDEWDKVPEPKIGQTAADFKRRDLELENHYLLFEIPFKHKK